MKRFKSILVTICLLLASLPLSSLPVFAESAESVAADYEKTFTDNLVFMSDELANSFIGFIYNIPTEDVSFSSSKVNTIRNYLTGRLTKGTVEYRHAQEMFHLTLDGFVNAHIAGMGAITTVSTNNLIALLEEELGSMENATQEAISDYTSELSEEIQDTLLSLLPLTEEGVTYVCSALDSCSEVVDVIERIEQMITTTKAVINTTFAVYANNTQKSYQYFASYVQHRSIGKEYLPIILSTYSIGAGPLDAISSMFASLGFGNHWNSDEIQQLLRTFAEFTYHSKNDQLTSQGGESAGGNTSTPADPASIKLTPDVRTMFMNESFTITATVLPENAVNKAVTFTSVDPNIVTVTSSGVVTAKSHGATRVYATTSNGVFATCFITVLPYEAKLSLNEYTLTRYHGNDIDVIVPDYVNSMPVTEIYENCFASPSISSVSFPKTIERISERLDSLAVIKNYYVDINNPHYCSVDGVVYLKNKKGLEIYPRGRTGTAVVAEGTLGIGYEAFEFCKITEVILPASIVQFSDRAFAGCASLTKIKLPNTMKSIGKQAFTECSSLETIEIPDSVTSLGAAVFYQCTSLKNVRLPNSITSIPIETFGWCTNLEQIDIPASVKTVEWEAFEHCENLKCVDLPIGLEYIEYGAFYNCYSLKEIVLPETVLHIEYHAFRGCSKLDIPIPEKLKGIEDGAFAFCGLSNIVIPENAKSIRYEAFMSCTNVQTVTFSNNLNSISLYAFNSCSALQYVRLPNSLISIGDCAFEKCSSLEYAEVPASVTSIGNDAFANCAENFKMYVEKNSYAHTYAIENDIPYAFIGDALTSDTYTIQDNLVRDIELATTVQDFIGQLDEPLYVVIYDQNGEICKDDNYIATNTVIRVEYNGDVRHEYTAVVSGDVNADGRLSTSDAVLSLEYALDFIELEGDAVKAAADFNEDGKVNTLDARYILKALVNTPE